MFSLAGCSDVNSSVLTFVLVGFGAIWYSGSGCIPEELCQVYPKSYNAYFVFQWFLRRGAEMLTLDC